MILSGSMRSRQISQRQIDDDGGVIGTFRSDLKNIDSDEPVSAYNQRPLNSGLVVQVPNEQSNRSSADRKNVESLKEDFKIMGQLSQQMIDSGLVTKESRTISGTYVPTRAFGSLKSIGQITKAPSLMLDILKTENPLVEMNIHHQLNEYAVAQSSENLSRYSVLSPTNENNNYQSGSHFLTFMNPD